MALGSLKMHVTPVLYHIYKAKTKAFMLLCLSKLQLLYVFYILIDIEYISCLLTNTAEAVGYLL